MARFRIESTRPAPAGFGEGSLGLVTFTYAPSVHDGPLKITRYVKPANAGDQGTRYDVASIVGGTSVKIIDAVLRKHNDRHFVSTGDIEVPRDVRTAVGEQAAKELARAASPAAAGSGEIEDDDIPF
jgi:hypothetical protein